MLEEDLAQRRSARVFVRVRGECGVRSKEWREREEFAREVQEDLERLRLLA